MDRFDQMKALVTSVDEGGFAAAGRKLGVSRIQVSRLVSALESRLGTQLLKRTTRTLNLTEIGKVFTERARILVAQMEDLEAAASQVSSGLQGTLQISAPSALGTSHIGPALNAFASQNPDLTTSLMLSDGFVPTREAGLDLTLFVSRDAAVPEDAQSICPLRWMVCASEAYLEEHGRPRSPDDLANHALLHFGEMSHTLHWPLRTGAGRSVAVSPVMVSNSAAVVREACIAGRGIALLPAYAVESATREGELSAVLEGFEPAPATLLAALPEQTSHPAKAVAFLNFLKTQFKKRPPGGPV